MNDDTTDYSDADEIPKPDEWIDNFPIGELTPEEHAAVKDVINGEKMQRFKAHENRYVVVGAGEASDAWERRMVVYDHLNNRQKSAAMTLEELGLGDDEIRIWAAVFQLLCDLASQVVAVIEDFEGGDTWELALLFAAEYRDFAWILKRKYEDEQTERERYDNSMGISHIKLLLTGDHAQEWRDIEDLKVCVSNIP